MKYIKITTSCNWPGTEQTQVLEVEDTISEEELGKIAWEQALEDTNPEGVWEWISEENYIMDNA